MNRWNELLHATRAVYDAYADPRDPGWRRLGRALEALPVQPTLFEAAEQTPLDELVAAAPGGARRGDPTTSKDAAVKQTPRTGSQRFRVMKLAFFYGEEGLTSSDVMEAYGWPHQTASTRFSECKRGGWLEPTGQTRRCPATNADREVLRVTEYALSKRHEFDEVASVRAA